MLVRVLFAAVAAFPIVFMLVSSLKPDTQIFGDMSSVAAFLPVGNVSFDNYAAVFDRVPAARFLVNSIGISAVTVVLGIFINSLCAFALSRMEVRGKRVVFTVILATLIVPFQTLALPLVWWVNQLPYFELKSRVMLTTEACGREPRSWIWVRFRFRPTERLAGRDLGDVGFQIIHGSDPPHATDRGTRFRAFHSAAMSRKFFSIRWPCSEAMLSGWN